jgi:HAD superfamily hydrolase (TIGR01662 family)
MSEMAVRAVLFDLGNTLMEYKAPATWRELLPALLERIFPVVREVCDGVKVEATEFGREAAEVVGGERAREVEHSGRSWHFGERMREGLRSVGLEAGEEALDRMTDVFYEPIHEMAKPYAETQGVLERLKAAGVPMAIITNSPWDTPWRVVRGDLEEWEVEGFFGAFVCSGDVAWRKPSPEFMWAAAEGLGVETAECLVVGDQVKRDVAGAAAAGMRSVWVNRDGGEPPEEGPRADWVVSDLRGVVEIVEGAD